MIKKFISYYKPHIPLFLLDMLCALGIALVDLAFPYGSEAVEGAPTFEGTDQDLYGY